MKELEKKELMRIDGGLGGSLANMPPEALRAMSSGMTIGLALMPVGFCILGIAIIATVIVLTSDGNSGNKGKKK